MSHWVWVVGLSFFFYHTGHHSTTGFTSPKSVNKSLLFFFLSLYHYFVGEDKGMCSIYHLELSRQCLEKGGRQGVVLRVDLGEKCQSLFFSLESKMPFSRNNLKTLTPSFFFQVWRDMQEVEFIFCTHKTHRTGWESEVGERCHEIFRFIQRGHGFKKVAKYCSSAMDWFLKKVRKESH